MFRPITYLRHQYQTCQKQIEIPQVLLSSVLLLADFLPCFQKVAVRVWVYFVLVYVEDETFYTNLPVHGIDNYVTGKQSRCVDSSNSCTMRHGLLVCFESYVFCLFIYCTCHSHSLERTSIIESSNTRSR
jgi:hypothetical protein